MPRPYQGDRGARQGDGAQPERQRAGRRGEAGFEQDEADTRMGVSPDDVMDDAFVSAALMEAYNSPDDDAVD